MSKPSQRAFDILTAANSLRSEQTALINEMLELSDQLCCEDSPKEARVLHARMGSLSKRIDKFTDQITEMNADLIQQLELEAKLDKDEPVER